MQRAGLRSLALVAALAAAPVRVASPAEIRPGDEPEWKRRTRARLRKRVTCGFRKLPLKAAVMLLQRQTDLAFTLDARAVRESRKRRVAHVAREDVLANALRSILEQAGLDYTLRRQGILITTRDQAGEAGEIAAEPAWMFETRGKLQRKISFEYVDTPLSEALQFFQTLTKVNMVLDPAVIEGRGDVPVTLQVTNEPMRDAFDRVLGSARLDYALLDETIFISTRDRLAREFERRTEREAKGAGPGWAEALRERLRRKVSFEFVDTPLSETIRFLQTLAKCSMILDPRAIEERGNAPVSLKVSDMPFGLALDWILRLADLEYALKAGAVFISTPEIIAREREAGLIPGSPAKRPPGTGETF